MIVVALVHVLVLGVELTHTRPMTLDEIIAIFEQALVDGQLQAGLDKRLGPRSRLISVIGITIGLN